MSWDILLQKFPENTSRPEQMPDDYLPPAIGSRAAVASAVRKLFRNAEYANESFITIDRSRFAIEISLGDEEPCSQLLLRVHDDHSAATKVILRLADHFRMRAIDCSSGEFIEVGRNRGRREVREKQWEDKSHARRKLDQHAHSPQPPLEYVSGVVTGPCDRYVYMTFLEGESPKQQQRAVFRYWSNLGKEHDELDAGISGPSFVLTLPDGEILGDFHVRRYPALVTESEAEMIPRVQKGAALVHAFAAATGRRCGEIENGSTLVCDDGQHIPLTQCVYRKLLTDADYAWKAKRKKKG